MALTPQGLAGSHSWEPANDTGEGTPGTLAPTPEADAADMAQVLSDAAYAAHQAIYEAQMELDTLRMEDPNFDAGPVQAMLSAAYAQLQSLGGVAGSGVSPSGATHLLTAIGNASAIAELALSTARQSTAADKSKETAERMEHVIASAEDEARESYERLMHLDSLVQQIDLSGVDELEDEQARERIREAEARYRAAVAAGDNQGAAIAAADLVIALQDAGIPPDPELVRDISTAIDAERLAAEARGDQDAAAELAARQDAMEDSIFGAIEAPSPPQDTMQGAVEEAGAALAHAETTMGDDRNLVVQGSKPQEPGQGVGV